MENDSTINWTEMTNNLFHNLSDGFVFLADKVQEAAPYAWEIAVRQAYAEAAADFVLVALLLIIAAIALRICLKSWLPPLLEKAKESSYYEGHIAPIIITFVIGIGLTVCSILVSVTLTNLIKVLINPDYYAILKIIEMAGLK